MAPKCIASTDSNAAIQLEDNAIGLAGIADGRLSNSAADEPLYQNVPSFVAAEPLYQNMSSDVANAVAEPLYQNLPSDVAHAAAEPLYQNLPSDVAHAAAEPLYQNLPSAVEGDATDAAPAGGAVGDAGGLEEVTATAATASADNRDIFCEPFNAIQAREINRILSESFAGFIDQIISKVQNMINTELQTSFDPVCVDLKNRMESLRSEIVYKHVPVQIGMRKYCFKHSVHASSLDNNLMHPAQLHVEDGPNNLMQIDQLHVGNSSELVRYLEKLVEDEVYASKLSDSNLMHSDQIDTGETFQDCIDYDNF